MPKKKQKLPPVKKGTYQHFKGHRYEVLGIARHSETLEPMVVYCALYGKKQLWVRPAKCFLKKLRPARRKFQGSSG